MKRFIFALLVVVSLAVGELELAETCDEDLCQLPDCRCSSTSIPGELRARDTPQFVTLNFDAGVNTQNILTYRGILYGRRNSNGCPAGANFFANHEYTNYELVNELYNNGFEIGLNSITHQTPQDYWRDASYETIVEEIADQRILLAHFANISYSDIKGVRLPFLQLAGNNSFLVMKDYGILYDSTWGTNAFNNPPLWPYTLDYTSSQDCPVGPCPTASIPGVWVQPLVSWIDLIGLPCTMVDACFSFPDRTDENAWYEFILANFERHYLNNRAPFGINIRESYISAFPAIQNALFRFLNLVNNLEDAFLVNANEIIEWVQNPVPIDEYKEQDCRTFTQTTCEATSCVVSPEHNEGALYYMQVCGECPRVFPWIGNPLGE